MRRVKNLNRVSTEVVAYLNRISNRDDNICTGTWYNNYAFINPMFLSSYWDDIDFLDEIDSTELPSPTKLLFYEHYNPQLTTFEEMYEILRDKKYHFDMSLTRRNIMKREFTKNLYKDIVALRGGDSSTVDKVEDWETKKLLSSTNTGGKVISMLHSTTKKTEALNRLYKLDRFLSEAENNESYVEFYERVGFDSVYNADRMVDFSKLHDTEQFGKLWLIFMNKYIGAMGEGINIAVTKKLETVPKSLYLKIIEGNTAKSKNLQMLEEFLGSLENKTKVRNNRENTDLLISISLAKLNEHFANNRATGLRNLLNSFIFSLPNVVVKDDSISSRLYTEIVDKVLENSENVSLAEIFALISILGNSKAWVRTGNSVDALLLLSELMRLDFTWALQLVSYFIYDNVEEPPTLTQWNDVKDKEMIGLAPSLVSALIDNSPKTKAAKNNTWGGDTLRNQLNKLRKIKTVHKF